MTSLFSTLCRTGISDRRRVHILLGFLFLFWGSGPSMRGEGMEMLVVVNKSDDTVSLLDAREATVLATLPAGGTGHEVAVHAGRARAVVPIYGTEQAPGNHLAVIDLRARQVARILDLSPFRRLHDARFFSDGRRVLVTAEADQAVLVVDIEAGRILQVIPTRQERSHMAVLDPDEGRGYVANSISGSVSVIDLKEGRLLKNIPTGAGAEGLDLSPDGTSLWVANKEEDTISILDTAALEVVQTLPCPGYPLRLKFTPGGQQVLVASSRSGEVVVFSSSRREPIFRFPLEARSAGRADQLLEFGDGPVPIGLVCSPDGQSAFVAAAAADLVFRLDLQNRRVTGPLRAGRQPDGLGVWSLP